MGPEDLSLMWHRLFCEGCKLNSLFDGLVCPNALGLACTLLPVDIVNIREAGVFDLLGTLQHPLECLPTGM